MSSYFLAAIARSVNFPGYDPKPGFHSAATTCAAGQRLLPDWRRGRTGVQKARTLRKGVRRGGGSELQGPRGSGSRGGTGGPGQRAAHLQDTVISTLVAGMLPAKESNSLSDAMSSGCSIAHRAPSPN